MIKVYVAGSYSSDNVMGVLKNIRLGIRAGTELLLDGYAPFIPWLDFHTQLVLHDDECLSVQQMQEHSVAWLEVADVMFVLPDYENSRGTLAEIRRAEALAIPIFFDRDSLDQYREARDDLTKIGRRNNARTRTNVTAEQAQRHFFNVWDKAMRFIEQLFFELILKYQVKIGILRKDDLI